MSDYLAPDEQELKRLAEALEGLEADDQRYLGALVRFQDHANPKAVLGLLKAISELRAAEFERMLEHPEP